MQDQAVAARALLENKITLVDRTVGSVSARYHLSRDEREELRSETMLKLLERNGRVLRRYRGESQLSTYLNSVVRRVLLDRRAREWGKWRNSKAATRMGPVAVRLETLTVRDGYTLDEAIEALRLDPAIDLGRLELVKLAEALPARTRRRKVDARVLHKFPSRSTADARLYEGQSARLVERALALVATHLRNASPEDRDLIRLRFARGWTVARIARERQLNQRRLYSRLNHLLVQLRRALSDAGIQRVDVLGSLAVMEAGGSDA